VLTVGEKLTVLKRLCAEINAIAGSDCAVLGGPIGIIDVSGTLFDIDMRTISGRVTRKTEVARNQMRRSGIRFRYAPVGGSEYAPW
jgi:hypothetical protein